MAEELTLQVQKALAGDQAAMRDLVDRYRDAVFRFCYRMLGQTQDAEDAAQETFVRMLKSLARWDVNRPFEPWLFAIAGNRCRTALSARQRRFSTAPMSEMIEETATDDSVDRQRERLLAEEVQNAMSHLRPEYREAFLLFHQQQLAYEDIAQNMDRPLGTIKTWIRRARQELMERLRRREVVGEAS